MFVWSLLETHVMMQEVVYELSVYLKTIDIG